MFQIEIDNIGIVERFSKVSSVISQETKKWLSDMALWGLNDLKKRVPVKTATLQQSIRYNLESSGDGGTVTYHSVFYGTIIDEGAKPFTIQAKGKPMVFTRGGDKVFTMTVNHPGIKARNFTLETLDAAEREADRQADVIANRIFGVIG